MSRDPEPYDVSRPFNADELMDGFTEDERVIHAETGTTLAEMAERARAAWSAFLAANPGDEEAP